MARFLVRVAMVSALAAWTWTTLEAAAAGAPAPELSITLRGVVDDALEQGEPLRVAVRLEFSEEGSVELAPFTGTWADAIGVELLAASSGAVLARGLAAGAPGSARATINRERVAGGMWIIPASSTQSLTPGDYIVRARLDLKTGAGWTGEVTSEDTPLSIVATSPASDRVNARIIARVQILISQGGFAEAARQLDAVLAKTPDDFELLCLRADLALAGHNTAAASICLSRATRLRSPQASGPPPPIFHEVHSRVLAAQLASASPADVPEWTWPPLAVLRLSEQETAGLLEKSSSAPAAISSGAPQATETAVGPSVGTVIPASELSEAVIRADGAGQWATSATAGSQYGRTQYSAAQATGAPNVPVVGNSPDAWCPANRDKGVDWLEVTFARPVHATEVRARQNDAAGAIARVEAIEPDGTAHVWWEGADPYQQPAMREIVWFAVRVPKTSYLVARVKLTFNLASGPGYKEIDAVQLAGAP